jgi:hypothetical protein
MCQDSDILHIGTMTNRAWLAYRTESESSKGSHI